MFRRMTINVYLLACVLVAFLSGVRAEPAVDASDVEELILAVLINGQKITQGTLIARVHDDLWIRREDLLKWRVIVPNDGAMSMDGEILYPLHAFAKLSYRVDEAQQALLIDAPAELFSLTQVAGSRGVFTKPTPSPL